MSLFSLLPVACLCRVVQRAGGPTEIRYLAVLLDRPDWTVKMEDKFSVIGRSKWKTIGGWGTRKTMETDICATIGKADVRARRIV